jgi:spermidine/putrescine transport system permease protein
MLLTRPMALRRRPSILAIITGLYLGWILIPLVLAIRVAVSRGGSIASPQGFSLATLRFALRNPEFQAILQRSFLLAGAVAAVATPVGAAMAIGLQRWRGSVARALTTLTVVAVVTPQAALGVAAFYTYIDLFHVRLQLPAMFLAHVTLAIPFVVLVVRARLLALPVETEEAALDLGASPTSMVRRVLLPLSVPALIVSAAIAFTLSFDNIVLSHWLCIGNDCRTLPGLLAARGGAIDVTPDLYAIGTVGIVVTLCMMTVVLLAFSVLRRQTRTSGESRSVTQPLATR